MRINKLMTLGCHLGIPPLKTGAVLPGGERPGFPRGAGRLLIIAV
jgi:hypothetical protein